MEHLVKALIPVFAIGTFLVLCVGIYSLFRGGSFNRSYSNKLMRLRIVLQFIAIILIAVASFVFR
ncbi:twin transmembrane helix small protein [Ferrovibrio xuzhouensis]|uniref:Twin transmembrane helix small protein n=1 Tax=Ferrovibrio xuzhouensis TaxID=1576914 RepID=A0ABV7V9Z0_9PROT